MNDMIEELSKRRTAEQIHQGVIGPYDSLARVLLAAYDQAASGKGKERHANEDAFEDQPIFTIAGLVGIGFNSGQAIKKISEAVGMANRGKPDAAIREIHGAIVYLASLALLLEQTPYGAEAPTT